MFNDNSGYLRTTCPPTHTLTRSHRRSHTHTRTRTPTLTGLLSLLNLHQLLRVRITFAIFRRQLKVNTVFQQIAGLSSLPPLVKNQLLAHSHSGWAANKRKFTATSLAALHLKPLGALFNERGTLFTVKFTACPRSRRPEWPRASSVVIMSH